MKRTLVLAAACVAASCQNSPVPPAAQSIVATPRPADVVVWKPVGTWTGRGNTQTESFMSDTGGFRVRWETRHETAPGAGALKVTFRSGDSGRPIIEAVDVRGAGHDTVEVADNVRWYFLTIESAGIEWTVSVDERLRGQTTR
jgi:hypothetical protein